MGRFIKKILYVGAFAFILNSFSTLSDIIFRSFAQAGLTAGGGTLTAADLLKPGRLAGTGFPAAWPLLEQVSQLVGFPTFDRKSVVEGKSVSVRVALGGRRIIKKKKIKRN